LGCQTPSMIPPPREALEPTRPSDGPSKPMTVPRERVRRQRQSPLVVHVLTRLNMGGPARQAIYLTRALPSRGFSCELISGTEGSREGHIAPPPDRHVRLNALRRELNPLQDLLAFWTLERTIRRLDPIIVHTHMTKAGALGRMAARQAGVPIRVHTFHGHVLDGHFSFWASRAILEVEKRLARWTDALLAVSTRVMEELLARGIGKPAQWRVVPVGFELDSLSHLPHSANARTKLGLPVGGFAVGIVARLVPVKNHELFLRAAAHIASARSDVWFVVAGDGELRPELEARARRLLGNRVFFVGWVDDLADLYASLDVVVLTSRNEGTPASLIEAGAARKPVVATRVGSIPDVVEDGRTGLLAPSNDHLAMAALVVSLIGEPAKSRSFGQEARTRVLKRYSADRLADELADIYAELIDKARQRGGDTPPLV
jgi:glycosyltransferase involved in cell wall biosynthesis